MRRAIAREQGTLYSSSRRNPSMYNLCQAFGVKLTPPFPLRIQSVELFIHLCIVYFHVRFHLTHLRLHPCDLRFIICYVVLTPVMSIFTSTMSVSHPALYAFYWSFRCFISFSHRTLFASISLIYCASVHDPYPILRAVLHLRDVRYHL